MEAIPDEDEDDADENLRDLEPILINLGLGFWIGKLKMNVQCLDREERFEREREREETEGEGNGRKRQWSARIKDRGVEFGVIIF